MIKKQNWQAYASKDRHSQIDEIKEAILSADAYISHFQFFSDLALSMTVVTPEMKIKELHRILSMHMRIEGLEDSTISNASQKEWYIFLNINFGKGKGNLSEEIPMVPG